MKILGILDILAGKLLLPTLSAAPGSPTASQLWLIAGQMFFRNAAGDETLRLLSSADLGVANGVATLDNDGLIPSDQLPNAATSVFSTPIGGGIDWFGDPNNIPSNCLVCDGSEYLRTDYPLLYAALRARFGRASNDLYFRVPDCVGRVRYGAWSYENSGYVRKIDIVNRGQGYTPGTYSFTFTGGTFTTAATGKVIIANETVPGVGTSGVIQRVEITDPGVYTSLGSAVSGTAANCALTIPSAAIPGGTGFEYDIFAQPDPSIREPYAAWSVQMNDHGTSYSSVPDVVISGATLKGATGYAVIRDGGVDHIVVTCRGTGSISGATVTITGGGGDGNATASLRTETRYMLSGEYIGEEEHKPLLGELVAHHHTVNTNNDDSDDDGGPRRNNNGVGASTVTTLDKGDGYHVPFHVPGVGSIVLVRAA